MGACLYGGIAKDVFVAGDHQSTFGGNPLATAAGRTVLKTLLAPGFLASVKEKGEYIRKTISDWKLPNVLNIRGKGLMIGVDVTPDSAVIQRECLNHGLCISTAGVYTLRFLPPLVITPDEINEGLSILKSVLQ